jgi:hypothetical protein
MRIGKNLEGRSRVRGSFYVLRQDFIGGVKKFNGHLVQETRPSAENQTRGLSRSANHSTATFNISTNKHNNNNNNDADDNSKLI